MTRRLLAWVDIAAVPGGAGNLQAAPLDPEARTLVPQGADARAGFEVTVGVADEPSGFIARHRGGPGSIIAITAEFDALPGPAQQAPPDKSPIAGQPAGHFVYRPTVGDRKPALEYRNNGQHKAD